MAIFARFLAIPGVKLLFPLLLASILIEIYEHIGRWVFIHLKILLHQMVHALATLLPFEVGAELLTRTVLLFLWACIPLLFFHLQTKRRVCLGPEPYAFMVGLTLWIMAAVLMSISL